MYQVENQDLISLLYQTGYLTIKSYKEDEDAFVLGFPNEEVKYGFLKEHLPVFALDPIQTGNFSIVHNENSKIFDINDKRMKKYSL